MRIENGERQELNDIRNEKWEKLGIRETKITEWGIRNEMRYERNGKEEK